MISELVGRRSQARWSHPTGRGGSWKGTGRTYPAAHLASAFHPFAV